MGIGLGKDFPEVEMMVGLKIAYAYSQQWKIGVIRVDTICMYIIVIRRSWVLYSDH